LLELEICRTATRVQVANVLKRDRRCRNGKLRKAKIRDHSLSRSERQGPREIKFAIDNFKLWVWAWAE
jgi:hypothetical protein